MDVDEGAAGAGEGEARTEAVLNRGYRETRYMRLLLGRNCRRGALCMKKRRRGSVLRGTGPTSELATVRCPATDA